MSSGQSWDPEQYAKHARFVAELGAPVVDLLAPVAGERILDLGCGDGALTIALVARGCDVVGVDASAEQVAAARSAGVDARVADAHALDFVGEFDAVFSNAALHWMRAPDRVLANVHRALRPGGRFVAECGGHGCVDTIHRALVAALDARGYDGAGASPWYFPTVDDYGGRLTRAGFAVGTIALFPRPTPLPGDLFGWLETFAGSFTRVLPPADVPGYLADVRARIEPSLRGPDGSWVADYVRLRFSAARLPD
jgi:trans-aconitate methyltransferase